MTVEEARQNYLKARAAYEHSVDRLARNALGTSQRGQVQRRPVGSPPNFVVPSERAGTEPLGGGPSLERHFDPNAGTLTLRDLFGIDPIQVWDSIALQLHRNRYNEYLSALWEYARLAPNNDDLKASGDDLVVKSVRSLDEVARDQLLGADESEKHSLESLAPETIRRLEIRIEEHKKLQSRESCAMLMVTLAELNMFVTDLDTVPQAREAADLVDRFLSKDRI